MPTIEQATFLCEVGCGQSVFIGVRAGVQQCVHAGEGQEARFQRRQKDGPEFKALGGVQRHDLNLFRLFADKIKILPQTHPLKQIRPVLVFPIGRESVR